MVHSWACSNIWQKSPLLCLQESSPACVCVLLTSLSPSIPSASWELTITRKPLKIEHRWRWAILPSWWMGGGDQREEPCLPKAVLHVLASCRTTRHRPASVCSYSLGEPGAPSLRFCASDSDSMLQSRMRPLLYPMSYESTKSPALTHAEYIAIRIAH